MTHNLHQLHVVCYNYYRCIVFVINKNKHSKNEHSCILWSMMLRSLPVPSAILQNREKNGGGGWEQGDWPLPSSPPLIPRLLICLRGAIVSTNLITYMYMVEFENVFWIRGLVFVPILFPFRSFYSASKLWFDTSLQV